MAEKKSYDKEIYNYNKFKSSIVWMLSISGMWPDSYAIPIRIFLSSFALSLIVSVSFLCAYKATQATEINGYLRGISMFIAGTSPTLRLFIFLSNQKTIKSLLSTITADFEQKIQDPNHRPELFAHFKNLYRIFNIYNFLIYSHLLFSASLPLVRARRGLYVRMYPLWLPFDTSQGGFSHWVVYGLEAAFSFFIWTVNCSGDVALGFFATHYCGEMRVLKKRFEGLRSGSDYKKDIKAMIDRHCELIEIHHKLEDLYGYIVVWVAIGTAINLCIPAYQVLHMQEWNLIRIYYFGSWACLKFTQSFYFAFVGNSMAKENKSCFEAPFYTPWTRDGDLTIRKDLLIMQEQKPCDYSAKGILTMDFVLFSTIVRAAISYFMLLQTLEENKVLREQAKMQQ